MFAGLDFLFMDLYTNKMTYFLTIRHCHHWGALFGLYLEVSWLSPVKMTPVLRCLCTSFLSHFALIQYMSCALWRRVQGGKEQGGGIGDPLPWGQSCTRQEETTAHTHTNMPLKEIKPCFHFETTLLSILNTLDFFFCISRELEEINPGCERARKQGCPLVSCCDSLKKPPLALNGFSAIIATLPPLFLFTTTWHVFTGATPVHVHILVIVKAPLRSIVLYKYCFNRKGPGKDGTLKWKVFFLLPPSLFGPLLHFFSSLLTLYFTLLAASCIDVES